MTGASHEDRTSLEEKVEAFRKKMEALLLNPEAMDKEVTTAQSRVRAVLHLLAATEEKEHMTLALASPTIIGVFPS
jgi:hypothetical protein